MRIIFYILVSILFIFCSSKENILPIDKVKIVMWDILTSDELVKLKKEKDSTLNFNIENNKNYTSIFKFHKIEKDFFYSSYNYYQSNPIEMKILLDSISRFGVRKRDAIANHLK